MSAGGSDLPGERTTRQRTAIAALLDDTAEFRSAQTLHVQLREQGDEIGLATVYRALQSMAAAGLVDSVRTDTGESLYRRCSPNHHHHLVCRSCGVTVEIAGRQVELWTAKVAKEHGYSDATHTVELFGLCAPCAERRRRATDDPAPSVPPPSGQSQRS